MCEQLETRATQFPRSQHLLPRRSVGASLGPRVHACGGHSSSQFAVAVRCPKTCVTLVENAPEMAECARRSIALPENAAFSDRMRLIEADVTLSGDAREKAGLLRNAYAATIMNPPFNSASDRATPDALKRAAHVMDDNLFETWLRTAAAITKPGGFLALIARPASLSPILKALEGRFGGARIVPVHGRAGSPAIRILLRAQKGNRAGLTLEPPLILRDADNQVTERTEALTNGQAALFGDCTSPAIARTAQMPTCSRATRSILLE